MGRPYLGLGIKNSDWVEDPHPAAFKVVKLDFMVKMCLSTSFNSCIVYKCSIFWPSWFLISVVHLYQGLFPRGGNWSYFKLFFCEHIFYLRYCFTRCRGQDPNHCCLRACAVVPATLLENVLFPSHHMCHHSGEIAGLSKYPHFSPMRQFAIYFLHLAN